MAFVKLGRLMVWGLWITKTTCGIIYAAQSSLNNRLTYEVFWGETPDISMNGFKLWDPVYYQNLRDKSGKFLMHLGSVLEFAWNIGYPMTFKVIQCSTNKHKRK